MIFAKKAKITPKSNKTPILIPRLKRRGKKGGKKGGKKSKAIIKSIGQFDVFALKKASINCR